MRKISPEEKKQFPPHRMNIFTLVMINVAAMISLASLPEVAGYGLSAIFYYLFAVVVFLIPVSLVAAELATGWPKHGGVYIWIKEALGPHWGFLAIFLQWVQIVFFYPTILTFGAVALVSSVYPDWVTNRLYIYLFIIIFFWTATFVNFYGMKISGKMSTIGVIAGTIIPGSLLILLALLSLLLGNPSQTPLSLPAFIPDLSLDHIIFAIGIFLTFAGMEMSATHAEEVVNPQKNFPKAIFITVGLVMVIMTLGAVAISIVVPNSDLTLNAGLMQAFNVFLTTFNISWLFPLISICLILGVFGTITTWIVGPTKGLLQVSRHGYLPPFFQKTNKNHVPIVLLILQGIIVSFIALIIFFAPDVDSAFWMLSSLAIQSYLIMYILLFITGIKLRYTEPDVPRAFRVPFMNIIAGLGIFASVFGLLVGFIPPPSIGIKDTFGYALTLFIIIIFVCTIPLSVYYLRRDSWDTDPEDKLTPILD